MGDTAALPKALQHAIERLLDADADSERGGSSRTQVDRIDVLRAARGALAAWRNGEIDLGEAVARIDALAGGGR